MPRPRKQINAGEQAHHLTAVKLPHSVRMPNGVVVWWVTVRCDCPAQTIKDIRAAEFGKTFSCGCQKGRGSGRPVLERNKVEPGMVFERLTVLEEVRVNGRRFARCECSCGKVKDVFANHLVDGNVRSCGCLNRELTSQRMKELERRSGPDHPGYKHGLALKGNRHPHYSRWEAMMNRCHNEKDPGYHNYGAIGVTVHEPWHDVVVFVRELDELLGPCPEGRSLERIDVFGNYEPGNLEWATPQQQADNRRNSKLKLHQMAHRVLGELRRRHPGHRQQWYIDFIERAALSERPLD